MNVLICLFGNVTSNETNLWVDIFSFIGTPLLSASVALITVAATFYLQEKRTTVRSLLAIKTEAESNREITADALLTLALDVAHDEPGSLTPSTLSAESYAVARNNGTISRISGETRELLSDHYTKLQATNAELSKIHDLWLQERSLNEDNQNHVQETLLTTEERTLEMLLMLFDDVENERIEDMSEYISDMKENTIGYFDHSYENVIDGVEEELESVRFSSLFR